MFCFYRSLHATILPGECTITAALQLVTPDQEVVIIDGNELAELLNEIQLKFGGPQMDYSQEPKRTVIFSAKPWMVSVILYV